VEVEEVMTVAVVVALAVLETFHVFQFVRVHLIQ
jgi:hypothetical protein